jgi:transposase
LEIRKEKIKTAIQELQKEKAELRNELIEKNREKLISDEGRKEYQKRMHTVEPVFGNIKFNLGFRQFLVRGTTKVKGEFNLMCIAHNIKKIATYCMQQTCR